MGYLQQNVGTGGELHVTKSILNNISVEGIQNITVFSLAFASGTEYSVGENGVFAVQFRMCNQRKLEYCSRYL